MNIKFKTSIRGNYIKVMDAFDLSLFEALKPPFGKMKIVEFTGSKIIQVGMGSSSELSFKFSKWADRFDGNNIPEWYIDPNAPADDDDGFVSPNEGLADKVAEMVAKTELTDDDIPF